MKSFLKYFVLLVFCLTAMPVFAQTLNGVAIIVNDGIISHRDIQARMDLIAKSSQIENTPANIEKLKRQVSEMLIIEELQIQEAESIGIEISDDEIQGGFAKIAEQNKMTVDQFKQMMDAQGLSTDTLRHQIQAQISWSNVIRRKLRPQIVISEGEIDAEIKKLRAQSGRDEYRIAEIFLAVKTPEEKDAVRTQADTILKRLIAGQSFSETARQFSQSPGATRGGDIGWVSTDQVGDEIAAALKKMKKGQVSPPIATDKGYYLIYLRDKRTGGGIIGKKNDQTISLKQIFIPVNAGTDPLIQTLKTSHAQKISDTLSGCGKIEEQIDFVPEAVIGDLGKVKLSELPAKIASMVALVPEGKASAPMRHDRGLVVLAVCERTGQQEKIGSEEERESIANKLGLQQLELLQKRYIQDLRAAAYIDSRL